MIDDIAVEIINSLSDITGQFKILDIGCHKAGVLNSLRPRLSRSSHWVGFDPSNHNVGSVYNHYFEVAVDNVDAETQKVFSEFPTEMGCNSLLELNVEGITHDKSEYNKKCWTTVTTDGMRKRPVKVNSAYNLLKSINYTGPIHFIKIDTQGNDINAVKSLREYLKETYYIQIETITSHNKDITLYKGQTLHEDDVKEMEKLGFKVFYIEDYSIGQQSTPEANVIFYNSNLLSLDKKIDTTYVSIGCCCGSAMLIKDRGLRTASYPFDWTLSHLDYVYDVITALYDRPFEVAFDLFYDKQNTDVYCAEVYHRGNPSDAMIYRTVPSNWNEWFNGKGVFNRKYKICFCHDHNRNTDVEETYRRRLQRLKDHLLDQNEFIRFVYTDAGCREFQYQVDGEILNEKAGEKLNKLCEYLKPKRKFDIIFINSMEDPIVAAGKLDSKIKRIPVTPKNNFYPMIKENVINFPELTENDYK